MVLIIMEIAVGWDLSHIVHCWVVIVDIRVPSRENHSFIIMRITYSI